MSDATSKPTTLTPHITCRDAMSAIEFYKKAFGATEVVVLKMPDGRLMHATLNLNGAMLLLAEEFPEYCSVSPLALGGSPVTLHLEVADCDAVFQQAVDAGCTVRMPLDDMFWGARYGVVADPYGHQWSIATTTKQLSPEEMQQAVTQMGGGCAG